MRSLEEGWSSERREILFCGHMTQRCQRRCTTFQPKILLKGHSFVQTIHLLFFPIHNDLSIFRPGLAGIFLLLNSLEMDIRRPRRDAVCALLFAKGERSLSHLRPSWGRQTYWTRENGKKPGSSAWAQSNPFAHLPPNTNNSKKLWVYGHPVRGKGVNSISIQRHEMV